MLSSTSYNFAVSKSYLQTPLTSIGHYTANKFSRLFSSLPVHLSFDCRHHACLILFDVAHHAFKNITGKMPTSKQKPCMLYWAIGVECRGTHNFLPLHLFHEDNQYAFTHFYYLCPTSILLFPLPIIKGKSCTGLDLWRVRTTFTPPC